MNLKAWNSLRDQFDDLLSAEPLSDDTTTSQNPVNQVLAPLEAARRDALEGDTTPDEDRLHAERRRLALEEEQRQIAAHRKAMFEDILALHKALATGFSVEELQDLSQGLHSSFLSFRERSSDSLADRGMLAVLRSVVATDQFPPVQGKRVSASRFNPVHPCTPSLSQGSFTLFGASPSRRILLLLPPARGLAGELTPRLATYGFGDRGH